MAVDRYPQHCVNAEMQTAEGDAAGVRCRRLAVQQIVVYYVLEVGVLVQGVVSLRLPTVICSEVLYSWTLSPARSVTRCVTYYNKLIYEQRSRLCNAVKRKTQR